MGKINNALLMLMLLNSREKMSRKELAEALEVDVRQVSRYKEDLCLAGFYIEEIRGRYGGYSLKKNGALWNIKLSENEIKAIEWSMNIIEENSFPLKEEFISAMMKFIEANQKGDISKKQASVTQIKRRNRVPYNRKEGWLKLNQYVLEQRKIRIEYSDMNDEITYRTISPYGIYLYEGANYVVGYCEYSNEIRNFKLVRINTIVELNEHYEANEFNLNEYLDRRLGIFNDRNTYNLKLRITYPYAKCFKEHRWISDEKIYDFKDKGYLIYEAVIEGKTDIIRWILEMGSSAKVLEPKEIKEAIKQECKNILEMYKE